MAVRRDPRGTNLGFRLRSWITRRAAQRHLWRPGQHTIGPFGLTKQGYRRLRYFLIIGGSIASVYMCTALRWLEQPTMMTPVHVLMADVGLFPHGDIAALHRVGKSEMQSRTEMMQNTRVYGAAGSPSETPHLDPAAQKFGKAMLAPEMPRPATTVRLQQRVSARDYDE